MNVSNVSLTLCTKTDNNNFTCYNTNVQSSHINGSNYPITTQHPLLLHLTPTTKD